MARELLGRYLVHRTADRYRIVRLVETEAYVSGDLANHARLGPTMRNRSMFGPPGTLYVYRIHQVHLANAVTRPGEAVLFRAAEPGAGAIGNPRGPGRLCRVLRIGMEQNGTSLIDGPVRILSGPAPVGRIRRGVRVGIRHDADRPLRFVLDGNRWISRPLRSSR
ncbi:MAG: DNA-3-methyladenine glycosylase [Thermoplasmata archaeon]|nr:DNA-3-methyladenine glycosylase [Thermoplasmata archaeon]MCI4359533.1 DNA-3-methyladenine glycosylase [Thermoplasmata archaeon]